MFKWIKKILGLDARDNYNEKIDKLKKLYSDDKEKSELCSKEKNYFG